MSKRDFVFGTLFGTAITAAVAFFMPHFWWHPHMPPPPGEEVHMMQERLSHELALSDPQRQSIYPILEQFHLEMLRLKLSNKNAMQPIIEKFEGEILPLLDAGQQTKLEDIKQKILSHEKQEEEFLAQRGK